jgi:hypothetical protein
MSRHLVHQRGTREYKKREISKSLQFYREIDEIEKQSDLRQNSDVKANFRRRSAKESGIRAPAHTTHVRFEIN